MTTTKNISRDGFAHIIIALLLVFNHRIFKEDVRKAFFWIGIVLLVVSTLAMIPIFTYYNKDYKYVIDMN